MITNKISMIKKISILLLCVNFCFSQDKSIVSNLTNLSLNIGEVFKPESQVINSDGNKIECEKVIYYNKKDEVGTVTSAVWSPMTKKSIALAQLKLSSSKSTVDNLWV